MSRAKRRCSCDTPLLDDGTCRHGCHLFRRPHKRVAEAQRGRAPIHETMLSREQASAGAARAGVPVVSMAPFYRR